MGDTASKRSLIITRLLVAALAGWITASALYVAGIAFGIGVSSTLLLTTAIIVAATIALFSDFIAVSLARYILNLITNDVEETLKPDYTPKTEGVQDYFLIKSFIRTLVEPAIPDIADVKIVVEGDMDSLNDLMMDPVTVEEIEELFPAAVDGWGYVTTIYYANGNLIVLLDQQVARTLRNTIERGDGEKAIIHGNEELVQIYDIVKKAYITRYPDSSNLMAAYVAYKTIRHLINSGLIEVPRDLINNLPYEPEEIKAKVLQQIEEENSY